MWWGYRKGEHWARIQPVYMPASDRQMTDEHWARIQPVYMPASDRQMTE